MLTLRGLKRKRKIDLLHIQPGPQGMIGEANLQTTYKTTSPDDPPRYYPVTAGQNEMLYGSNVQDGAYRSWLDDGGVANVINDAWVNPTPGKTEYGWEKTDIIMPDRVIEPFVESQLSYGWQSKMHKLGLDGGAAFKEMPKGFSLEAGQLPRGGLFPRVVSGHTPNDSRIAQELLDPKGEQLAFGRSAFGRGKAAGRAGMGAMGAPQENIATGGNLAGL